MKKIIFLIILFLTFFIPFNLKAEHSTYIETFYDFFNTNIEIKIVTDNNSFKSKDFFDKVKYEIIKYNNLCDPHNKENTNIHKPDIYKSKINLYSINYKNINEKIEIDKELYDILEKAISLSKKTNNYFNFTIGKIINIYKEYNEKYKDFKDKEISEIEFNNLIEKINKEKVYEFTNDENTNPIKLLVENNRYYLIKNKDIHIDLGGLTKGYVTELIKQMIKKENISEYFINSGTSSIYVGKKYSNEKYIIPINSSYNDGGTLGTLKVSENKSITTSGNYVNGQFFTHNGIKFHHIISPITKKPESFYNIVTLLADDAGDLDAYSTATFSMKYEELKEFCEKNNILYVVRDIGNNETKYNIKNDSNVSFDVNNNYQQKNQNQKYYFTFSFMIAISIIFIISIVVVLYKKINTNLLNNIYENSNSKLLRKLTKTRLNQIIQVVIIVIIGILVILIFLMFNFAPRSSYKVQIYHNKNLIIDYKFNDKTVKIVNRQDSKYPIIKKEENGFTITILGDYKIEGIRQEVKIFIDNKNKGAKITFEKSPNNICSLQGFSNGYPLICLPNNLVVKFVSNNVKVDGDLS